MAVKANATENAPTPLSYSSPTIQNRLQDAKRTIRDITNQTIESISTETQSLILGQDPCCYNNGIPVTDDGDDDKEKQELDLAVTLFGGDESQKVEERNAANDEIQKRLTAIETQLGLYCDAGGDGTHNHHKSGGGMDFEYYHDKYNHDNHNLNDASTCNIDFSALVVGSSPDESSSFEMEDEYNPKGGNNNTSNRTSNSMNHSNKNSSKQKVHLEEALQNEAVNLKAKIHFLQNCTEARMALDELESYSMEASSSSSSSSSSSFAFNQQDKEQEDGSTSHLSPASSHSFDSSNSISSSHPKPAIHNHQHHKKYTLLIPMAKCLAKAQIALQQAEEYLNSCTSTTASSSSSTNPTTNNNNNQNQDIIVANQILESIRLHIIRKLSDLNGKVTNIIQDCIQIHSDGIVIVSTSSTTRNTTSTRSTKSTKKISEKREYKNDALKIAFEVLSILSESTSTTTSSSTSSESTTNGYVDKLSSRLQYIANEIKLNIIKPIIREIRDSIHLKTNDDTMKMIGKALAFQCYEVESTDDSRSSSLVLPTSTSAITTTATAKVKRNIVTLKWNEISTDTSTSENKANEIDNNVNNNTHDLAWWNHLLAFIQSIVTFIHKHVLFQDENLSKIFGQAFLLEEDLVMTHLSSTPSMNSRSMIELNQRGGNNSNKKNFSDEHYDQSPLIQVLITLLGDECIPNDISLTAITNLPLIINCLSTSTESFENYLIQHNFIHKDYDGVEIVGSTVTNYAKQTKLSEFAKSVITTYAEKQRLRLLTQGRSLLLDSDYHNTMRIGTNVHEKKRKEKPSYYDDIIGLLNNVDDDLSVYVLHESSISVIASDLVKLCEETMDVAVNTDFNVDEDLKQLLPNMLYRGARELFDLYRAIIPATYGKEISTLPRTAAVLHNDCVYFAHRLLTLGLEYRDRFPGDESPVKCTFIDLVPTLRELADQTMTKMIKFQMQQVSEIIKPRLIYLVDSLKSNEAVTEWTDAEMALQGGMYHLKHLSQSWWKVLSYDIYCRTMGNLVDTMFSLFLDELMKAKDISEPACHFVYSLFRDAVNGAAELYSMDEVNDAVKEGARFCIMWHKFDAIGKFMNMSLSDITMNLSKGTFREITAPELSRMVLAVFENSERRQKLLHLLANNFISDEKAGLQ